MSLRPQIAYNRRFAVAAVSLTSAVAIAATGIAAAVASGPTMLAAQPAAGAVSAHAATPAAHAKASAPATPHVAAPAPATVPATNDGPATGSEPVPAGFPSAASTGVPVGTALTPVNGGLIISTPGTVVRDALINGCVTIKASNVTIIDSKIVCAQHEPVLRVVGGAHNVAVTGVEIDGGGVALVGIEGQNFTATAVNIYGTGDGAHLGGGATVQFSYIHDLAQQPGLHHDDLQTVSGTVGSNIRVLRNTLQDKSAAFNGNSSYHLGAGDLTNVTVTGNYMDGGSYTIQVDNGTNQHNIDFTGNTFGRDYRFGIITETENGGAVQFTGNVYAGGGLATMANSRGTGQGHSVKQTPVLEYGTGTAPVKATKASKAAAAAALRASSVTAVHPKAAAKAALKAAKAATSLVS